MKKEKNELYLRNINFLVTSLNSLRFVMIFSLRPSTHTPPFRESRIFKFLFELLEVFDNFMLASLGDNKSKSFSWYISKQLMLISVLVVTASVIILWNSNSAVRPITPISALFP